MKIKLTHNLGLKVAALIFSVVLWLIVINISDPMDSVTYSNIPVEFTNEEVVTNMGKTYDLVGDAQPVRVTVSGTRSVVSRITSSSIVAIADLSQMEVNTYLVPITAEVRGTEGKAVTTEVTPGNLQIKIEDMARNTYPISVSTPTNIVPRDGYAVGDVTANPEKITIWGTESAIKNIQRVVVRPKDSSGLSESTTLAAELVIYDGNGNPMDQSQLTNNLGERGLSVNVEILRKKTVSLSFGVSGDPADGFIYTGCTAEPSRIDICGTKEVLDAVSVIEIPDSVINISGRQSREEVTVDILPYLPEGIRLADETANNVVVNVMIEQEGARTIELPVGSIQINNLKEDLKLSFESDMDIELQFRGREEDLAILDVRYAASIDLRNYKTPGTYEVAVNIETPSHIELTKNPTVKIILTEKDGG